MIYFFTPYSFNFKLLDAIASCKNLLNPDHWAVIMDGDTIFLQPDSGQPFNPNPVKLISLTSSAGTAEKYRFVNPLQRQQPTDQTLPSKCCSR